MMASDLAFPVLALWRDEGGDERFSGYDGIGDLQSIREAQLRRAVGTTLVANDGRTFTVRALTSTGYGTPLWLRALMRLFKQDEDMVHRVVYDLEEVGPMAFHEVQRRVWEAVERDRDEWLDLDDPDTEAALVRFERAIEEAEAAVKRACSVQEMFAGLDAAWAAALRRSDDADGG